MKKIIIGILLGLALTSCYAGVGIGRGGLRGNVGIYF